MKIPRRQDEIDAFVKTFWGAEKPTVNGHQPPPRSSSAPTSLTKTDEEVVAKARAERNGKFDRLWCGDLSDFEGNHSGADESFVYKLWPYTQDEEQIRSIHAASGLHRPEKSGRRSDYLQRSINHARDNVTWFYPWPDGSELNSSGHGDTRAGGNPSPEASTEEDVGITKRLADTILADDHFAQDAGGKLYHYSGGTYRNYGDRFIKRRVQDLLEEWGESKKWSSHRASEAVEYIRVKSPELWEEPPLDEVNLNNGILNVWTRRLRNHDPGFLSTVRIPVEYDPDATCPAWGEFVASTFPEDAQALAYELAADLMTPERSEQKSILLIGEGSNGKSTYLAAMSNFVGSTNIVGLSLQKMESDRFSSSRLLGKLANICPDLPSSHLVGTSMFKAVTGGDAINAEYKYKESFEFRPFARLVFSANQVPRSEDATHAFFRRWLVVPFDRTFEGKAQTPRQELDAKLSDAKELSGVLNKALDALPGLRRNGFTESESMREAWTEFRAMTDPVSVWLDKNTVEHPDAYVSRDVLWQAYNDQTEHAKLTKKAFGQALKRARPRIDERQVTIGGRRTWCWIGIALRSGEPEPPDQGPGAHYTTGAAQHAQDAQDSSNCFLNGVDADNTGAEGGGGSEITNKENPVHPVHPVHRDPLAHTDTEKAKFFRGGAE